MAQPIYKILPASGWTPASEDDVPWAPVDHRDGFMHCSTLAQVLETAARHFADQAELWLAEIDPALLPEGVLRWEPSRGGQLFPHVYGSVRGENVRRAWRFPRTPDGVFALPTELHAASPERVRERLREIYGRDDLHHDTGMVHVLAVAEQGGALRFLRIGPEAPRSETDRFVLGYSRARADVIITTGSILRHEPDLRYDLPEPYAGALRRWREDTYGPTLPPPRVLVLTRGSDLDLAHPAFHGWARPLVFTGRDSAAQLGELPPGVSCVGVAQPSIFAAVAWAHRDGARTISIEAGPSAALPLYENPMNVDEILLSRFQGSVAAGVAGGDFLDPGTLARVAQRTSALRRHEDSGPWSFERWRLPERRDLRSR